MYKNKSPLNWILAARVAEQWRTISSDLAVASRPPISFFFLLRRYLCSISHQVATSYWTGREIFFIWQNSAPLLTNTAENRRKAHVGWYRKIRAKISSIKESFKVAETTCTLDAYQKSGKISGRTGNQEYDPFVLPWATLLKSADKRSSPDHHPQFVWSTYRFVGIIIRTSLSCNAVMHQFQRITDVSSINILRQRNWISALV